MNLREPVYVKRQTRGKGDFMAYKANIESIYISNSLKLNKDQLHCINQELLQIDHIYLMTQT